MTVAELLGALAGAVVGAGLVIGAFLVWDRWGGR